MNFYPNMPNTFNMPIDNPMIYINNMLNKLNEFESRIKKLEQRITRLENENNINNNNYKEPDNSMYMI